MKTLNTFWGYVTGIDEWWKHEFLKWPPDLFLLTASLLQYSGIYRHILIHNGKDYQKNIKKQSDEWRKYLSDQFEYEYKTAEGIPLNNQLINTPHDIESSIKRLFTYKTSDICNLKTDDDFINLVLELNSIADEASFKIGFPVQDSSDYEYFDNYVSQKIYNNKGWKIDFSFSQNPYFKIFPKLRTVQSGININNLSHNLCLITSETEINWSWDETLGRDKIRELNILIIPWPFKINGSYFSEYQLNKNTKSNILHKNTHGYFKFDIDEEFNSDLLIHFFEEGLKTNGKINIIVFPESSLTLDEYDEINGKLDIYCEANEIKVRPYILAGIRELNCNDGFADNYLLLATKNDKDRANKKVIAKQHKHHRWALDTNQISMYKLARQLSPNKKWWEAVNINDRKQNIHIIEDWISICPLICEDLARQDPVANVIRALGPNLVICLLLDGPQLQQRWSGRYSTVLVDDPGSSVLTVSAKGMTERSIIPGQEVNHTIALWKDKINGTKEIKLPNGYDAVVLKLNMIFETEVTADGRFNERAPIIYLNRKNFLKCY